MTVSVRRCRLAVGGRLLLGRKLRSRIGSFRVHSCHSCPFVCIFEVMRFRAVKYFAPVVVYLGACHAFTSYGISCYALLIYSWIVVPFLELFIDPNAENLSDAESELARQDKLYDWILYTIVLLQVPMVFLFCYSMQDPALTWIDKVGRIGTMGMLCGTFGINVGHELGHRTNKIERALAKLSLMTSLYIPSMAALLRYRGYWHACSKIIRRRIISAYQKFCTLISVQKKFPENSWQEESGCSHSDCEDGDS